MCSYRKPLANQKVCHTRLCGIFRDEYGKMLEPKKSRLPISSFEKGSVHEHLRGSSGEQHSTRVVGRATTIPYSFCSSIWQEHPETCLPGSALRNTLHGRKVNTCGSDLLSAEFYDMRTELTVPIRRHVSARTEPIRGVFGPLGLSNPNCSPYP